MAVARSHVRAQSTWIVFLDLLCLLVGGVMAVTMRIGVEGFASYFRGHLDGLLVFLASIILANYVAGSYRLQYAYSRFNLVVTWLFSLVFALAVLSITSYAWFEILLGRGVLIIWMIAYSVISLSLKLLVYRALFRSPMFLCKAVIIGDDHRAREMRQVLENPFVLPAHRVVAFLRIASGQEKAGPQQSVEGVGVMDSTVVGLAHVVRRLGVNLIVIALDADEAAQIYPQLRRLRFEGIEVMMPLSVYELYSGRTPLRLVNEESLTQLSMESGLPVVRRVKRLLDVILSLVAVVLGFPLALLTAGAIKLSAPRLPVLYTQLRVGQFGKTFRIFKFRTMHHNAERATGPVWSSAKDARITRLGRILRRYRLDELPQIVNILRGDMSLVGPRPERPSISAELARKVPFFEERENVMPGLTGWAQVRHPYGNTIDDAVRKLEYDLYYIKHVSLSLDLQILLSTMRIVMLGKERTV